MKNTSGSAKTYGQLLPLIMEELILESESLPMDTLAEWFDKFGAIIQWCGSGDTSKLPDEVKIFLAENYPGEMPLQLVAGKGVD